MTTAISRDDRVVLACSYYGLYAIGMATNDFERTDENCAMDNVGVPYYQEQLTEDHLAVLKRHAFYRDFVGPPLPISNFDFEMTYRTKLRIYEPTAVLQTVEKWLSAP